MTSRMLVIVLAAAFLLPAVLEAGTTGKIAGVVKDAQTREELVGANVVVEGTAFGAATNVEGYYVILNLPPGTYRLVASAVGYSKKTVADVRVSVDLTTTINIDLGSTVLEVGEEVVVTAERPIVRKDLTSTESRVDASTIESLPVTEVQDVISLQAGVTTASDGGIHIRGGRTSEVAYWVDGVSVSDVYDRSQAVQVDNQSVQELQVISGTFNAEYGQAMSGVVNIVTKDGDQHLRGNVSVWMGDYLADDGWSYDGAVRTIQPGVPPGLVDESELYYNLGGFNPTDNYNLEASLSGPIPGVDALTFYLSGRYFTTDGYLYGQNLFFPTGVIDERAFTIQSLENPNEPVIALQDNPMAMNSRQRRSGQGKLTWQVSGSSKVSLSGLISSIDFRDYSHDWRFTPDGDVRKYDRGYNLTGQWNQTLGSTAFYTVSLSYFLKNFREYLYEDPLDPRYFYVDPTLADRNSTEFINIGVNGHQFKRSTETRALKFDYTDQISRLHQIKAGLEGRIHRLYLEDYNVVYPQENNFQPAIPASTSNLYVDYTETPVELSAYIQDKLEYESMVVNIGFRFDYFNSNGQVLADPSDPNIYDPLKPENKALTLEERQAIWYKDAGAKWAVSPRFGISYPITDKGILHFSYGHFLQIPSFIHLYQNAGYKVAASEDVQGPYGNADLEPEQTIMYELGLQQQVAANFSFDATIFYKDTRDWVTTGPEIPTYSTRRYQIYINRDYANTKGFVLSVYKRPVGDIFSAQLAYTFQVAEGINSNPDDERAALLNNSEPARSLTPLNWDQKHQVNLSLGLTEPDWGAFLVGRYGSGFPYTPSANQAEATGGDVSVAIKNNSRRRPESLTFDIRAYKNFALGPVTLSAFLRVFNLFDTRNESNVYSTTGRATTTPEIEGLSNVTPRNGVNTVSEYLIRPDYYSEPRELQFGVDIMF